MLQVMDGAVASCPPVVVVSSVAPMARKLLNAIAVIIAFVFIDHQHASIRAHRQPNFTTH